MSKINLGMVVLLPILIGGPAGFILLIILLGALYILELLVIGAKLSYRELLSRGVATSRNNSRSKARFDHYIMGLGHDLAP